MKSHRMQYLEEMRHDIITELGREWTQCSDGYTAPASYLDDLLHDSVYHILPPAPDWESFLTEDGKALFRQLTEIDSEIAKIDAEEYESMVASAANQYYHH